MRDIDEYGAAMTLPLREAVALICQDLEVTPDWSLWTKAPPPPPDGGGGGPRRGGGGACALWPAEAPQSPHPRRAGTSPAPKTGRGKSDVRRTRLPGLHPAARLPGMAETPAPAAAGDIAALSFEQALAELEKIVGQLESGQAPLEESIALYERGARLKAHCEARLEAARLKVEKIVVGRDGSVERADPAEFT